MAGGAVTVGPTVVDVKLIMQKGPTRPAAGGMAGAALRLVVLRRGIAGMAHLAIQVGRVSVVE